MAQQLEVTREKTGSAQDTSSTRQRTEENSGESNYVKVNPESSQLMKY